MFKRLGWSLNCSKFLGVRWLRRATAALHPSSKPACLYKKEFVVAGGGGNSTPSAAKVKLPPNTHTHMLKKKSPDPPDGS